MQTYDPDGYYVECVLCREFKSDETNLLCTEDHPTIAEATQDWNDNVDRWHNARKPYFTKYSP